MREKIIENKELIKIWDYKKNANEGNYPERLTCGSHRIVWWVCGKGHSFKQAINKKNRNPKSCPVCTGHRTIVGVNDFETLHPNIAKEWHPTKNGKIKPNELSEKNGRKVWWICKYGHEWEARIHDRVGDNTGCPICSSRRNTSFPEQAVYYYVHKLYPDTVNRFKDIFDNQMELDIYVPSRKIGIEFDGGYFHDSKDSLRREREKYRLCKENNIKLIRIKQGSIDDTPYDTADIIYGVNRKMDLLQMSLVIQTIIDDLDPESNIMTRKDPRMFHSKVHVNLYDDMTRIKEYLTPISNSLVDLRPDLVNEWHPTKNGNLKPEMFGINSNDRVWWKCSVCGYEWQTIIIQRGGKRHSGCPKCMNKQKTITFIRNKIKTNGSLASNNKKLAEEFHSELNGDLTPYDITEKTNKKVWWKCKKCGYEWQQSPGNRSRGIGCPCCSGRVPMKGVNDIKTLDLPFVKEWDYKKNGDLKPENFLPNSGKKIWWKCKKCGNEWLTEIRTRNKGHGCPKCNHKRK